jgi:hypothetical protein
MRLSIMNKLTQQPTYTHHRNQTRACTCYSPDVTAFLTHAKAAHRATQQLRPPAYFKAAYAITRQELATLISDSRHTTPGLRLGVAFAMSSHVTDATLNGVIR